MQACRRAVCRCRWPPPHREADYWPLLQQPPPGVHVHVVRGGESDRWTPETVAELDGACGLSGGRTLHHLVPKAGHWVHVDNPDGLLAPMLQHLAPPSRGS